MKQGHYGNNAPYSFCVKMAIFLGATKQIANIIIIIVINMYLVSSCKTWDPSFKIGLALVI
jgi:hypothetical protein